MRTFNQAEHVGFLANSVLTNHYLSPKVRLLGSGPRTGLEAALTEPGHSGQSGNRHSHHSHRGRMPRAEGPGEAPTPVWGVRLLGEVKSLTPHFIGISRGS